MSNVIVLDSSDEEETPAKKIKTNNNIPTTKQKIQIIQRQQNVQQQQQSQPFKKVQNSIQITPIYNNNNSSNSSNNNNSINSSNNNQKNNNINTGLRNHLDKINNSISINSIVGRTTINSVNKNLQTTTTTNLSSSAIKLQSINNNNGTPKSPINELNSLKTLRTNINNSISSLPINLPNSIKNTITVKRINSPITQQNINNIQRKSLSPITATTIGGINKKSINIQQQRKKESIDSLKITEINKINQQKNIVINNNNSNNNINNDKVPLVRQQIKRKLSEKTNFEKNLEQQIAQRQQKPPSSLSSQQQQQQQIKRIKPITISNKIDSNNWLNNQSPIITIDDDDDLDNNTLQLSPKPFSVTKLNNNYIKNNVTTTSPLIDLSTTTTTTKSIISPIINTTKSTTITTKSITHTITSPIEILTDNNNDHDDDNNNDINKNNNIPQLTASSTSTSPNSKNQDDNDIIIEKNLITPSYEELLKVCRQADPSNDMEKLINKKLLKYYHSVHPDFVTSKGFRKTIELTITEIKNTPDLVYLKIKTIIEELKTRKNSKQTIVNNEEHTTTGDIRKDDHVKKLSRALYKIQMIIKKLEEDDVDWENDSNSPYLKVERFKKRACEIYEKICDLTGESKHAHRLVSKPISFQGTSYPPFNKTIQAFVNRTKSFPDYLDVYRLLEFCNKQNSWQMSSDEMKAIAQDAFVKIGKLLQKRRQNDLYETVIHFTGDAIDPAENDTELNAKLNENQKHITKISTILEKFSKQQDYEAAEKQKAKDEKNNENITENDNDNDEKINEKSDNENVDNILKLNILEKTSTITSTTTTTSSTSTTTALSKNKINRSISQSENNLNTLNNKLINSINNPQPSTSKCSSEIRIHSVQSLKNKNNNNNYTNHNIVGEIVLSDDDDET